MGHVHLGTTMRYLHADPLSFAGLCGQIIRATQRLTITLKRTTNGNLKVYDVAEPPLAHRGLTAVPVGSAPPEVVGTEKFIRHPVVVGQFTGLASLLFDSTLRKIQSLVPSYTSVTGEQVVPAVERASTPVLGFMALALIGTW